MRPVRGEVWRWLPVDLNLIWTLAELFATTAPHE
jgi:hypothetical protein